MVPQSLSTSPLFRGLPSGGLAALTLVGEPRHFAVGERLMCQGEESDCLYLLMSGTVRVERAHPPFREPIHVADLCAGTTVGEMGVLDGAPRSATVIATTPTMALRLGAATLAQTMASHPEVGTALLHILSQRTRSIDQLLAYRLNSTQDHAA
jgi:CRP-like cAMP-binding protein